MRCLITGTDAAGRSCVVNELEAPVPQAGEPVDVWPLFRSPADGPPARPPGGGESRYLGVRPGQLRWVVSRWEPDSQRTSIHHTDTVDLDLVVAGSIDLLLDDGPHHLATGDCVVISGVDHAWSVGPEGCTLSVVLLGTPLPVDSTSAGASASDSRP